MKKSIKYISVLLCFLLMINSFCITVSAAESEYPGDPMVYLTQVWLNQQYGDVSGFGSVTENGKTGYDTVNGLLRALQHELGITALANSFGPATTEKYSQNILCRADGVTNKMYAILQGALWCKGYNPGYKLYMTSDGRAVYDEVFDDTVENAVINLKRDMGFISPDGTVTVDVMKALMSMDSFKNVGNIGIYQLQQSLNRKYGDYIGIIACDGIYSRSTQTALIKCLQAVEGLSPADATGNFGNTTKALCPDIPYTNSAKKQDGTPYSAQDIADATEILKCALTANGYGNWEIDGQFTDKTAEDIRAFQKDLALEVTGRADIATWMSLLTSHGDTTRPALAADCMTKLDAEKAKALFDNGYRYVGRYLTVDSKAITKQEAQTIFDAGLKFFPIYQTSADKYDYFTAAKGTEDAKKAADAAKNLGLPLGTVIYFAVDFDPTDVQITNAVIPYFESLNAEMSGYKIGVYGTRNVCTKVSDNGYAVYSFVADMSSGYSGNLGFKMPKNWAFDQFATVNVGGFAIDKNAYSGRDACVGALTEYYDTAKIFTDVKAKGWYKKAVDYSYNNGFISGMSATEFGINTPVTRGMFITILARIAGVDTSGAANKVQTKFADVKSGKYYTAAIKWASENGVVTGLSDTEFGPDAAIERQQLCRMIVNFAKYMKIELKALQAEIKFTDESSIRKYAKTAVATCQKAGIVSGYAVDGGMEFRPLNTATRAEAAQILYKFHSEFAA